MRRIFLASLLLAACCAHAELEWDKHELIFRPTPAQTKAVGEFTFTNAGKEPVTIVSTESSCDCATAELAKKTYQPGEKGVITVTFVVGDRTGEKHKTVTVKTDNPGDAPIVLAMTFFLPEGPTIKPSYVFWENREPKDSKTISVAIGKDCPFFPITSIFCGDSRMKAELKTIQKDKEYLIVVTPKDTKYALNAVIELFTEVPPGNPRKFRVYAGVMEEKPPKAPEKAKKKD